ncbi:MAG: DUF3267 domain-containing protein [Bacillota bacterium]|nr:DUF3267 domain-containing protein [Bacillota bacterium]
MKIQNKGIISTYAEAEGQVPQNAVKYIDPEAMEREGKGTAFYCIMAMVIPIIIFSIKYAIIKETPLMFSILGIAIGCVLSLPRELLRGMMFPAGSKVELYQMMKPPRMFVSCDKPMSKSRFIFVNLFPNIVLGLIPLLIWLYISPYTYLARTLFSIGFICVITGGRDYMNILKTIGRVPPFSKIQMSGAKIYYFYNLR